MCDRPGLGKRKKFVDQRLNINKELGNPDERNFPGPIAKRWLNQEICLHAHLGLRSLVGESEAEELCLVFVRQLDVRPPKTLLQEDGIPVPCDKVGDSLITDIQPTQIDGAVFVDIGEVVKDGEEMVVGVLTQFQAKVRLLPVDDCAGLSIGIDPIQRVAIPATMGDRHTGIELRFVRVDRKGVSLDGRLPYGLVGLRENELPDKMIERAPDVINGIAADDEQARRREFFQRWVCDNDVPRFVVGTIDSRSIGVRLEEGAPFRAEFIDVVLGSVELGLDSL
jgi:hypothetical protein